MHYTRRKTDGSLSITFDDEDGTCRVVKPELTVRWLGLYFDRKLCFQKHASILATWGENTVSGLTMLTNTICGLSQAHLHHLYLVCVVFGSPVPRLEKDRDCSGPLKTATAVWSSVPQDVRNLKTDKGPVKLVSTGLSTSKPYLITNCILQISM